MSEQEVRERILEAATRLFGEKGYGDTSIRDVARAAGVTNPALYYHFGSKEGLYLATVRQHLDAQQECVRAVIERDLPARRKMHDFLASQIEWTANNRAAARLMMHAHHTPASGEPQVDMMSVHQQADRFRARLLAECREQGLVRPDVSDGVFAALLIGPLMIVCYAVLHGYPMAPDPATAILDAILGGIGPRDTMT